MAYNLFIAYDLLSPGQNYNAVREKIESLGKYHQFQLSLYYVSTQHSPQEAFAIVSPALDVNDKLIVIDARAGVVSTWDNPPIDAINAIWTQM